MAVVANSWWQAKKARDVISIQWDEGAGASLTSEGMIASTRAAAASSKPLEIAKPQGNLAEAMKTAAKVVEAEYVQPLQAHVPLEPMNFTAHVNGDQAMQD